MPLELVTPPDLAAPPTYPRALVAPARRLLSVADHQRATRPHACGAQIGVERLAEDGRLIEIEAIQ
jgi:hypothetical protein